MRRIPNRTARNNLAAGIEHGPHKDIPAAMLAHYLILFENNPNERRSRDQFIDDTRSEWLYDQYSEKADQAQQAGRITMDHFITLENEVLRPLFIGWRNENDSNPS